MSGFVSIHAISCMTDKIFLAWDRKFYLTHFILYSQSRVGCPLAGLIVTYITLCKVKNSQQHNKNAMIQQKCTRRKQVKSEVILSSLCYTVERIF